PVSCSTGTACNPARRAPGSGSRAASPPSSTDRSPKPRSLSPVTGCGRSSRSTRPSNGPSGAPAATTSSSSCGRCSNPPTSARRTRRSAKRRRSVCARSRPVASRDGRPPVIVPGRRRNCSERRVATSDIHRTIDTVWRMESARVIAGLGRMVHDIGLAEDLAQDALVAALEQWPESGVPDKPGAWLMAIAKRRAIDHLRRQQRLERKQELLGHDLQTRTEPDLEDAFDDDIGDDLLRLIFTACHPVLSTEARVALTLRTLGGLKTDEIAQAFLVPESTIAQRIVRAKRTLTKNDVRFELPVGDDRVERLSSVLEVIYLVFNEGYSAT